MSDETKNFFFHDPFISSTNNNYSFSNSTSTDNNHDHQQLWFDPQYMMSFTNFDGYMSQGMQRDFDESNPEMFSSVPKEQNHRVAGYNELSPTTPNSSISSSSNEAGEEDKSKKINCDQPHIHDLDNMGESSNKVESKEKLGMKKKAEKKERQSRFAFMTKSEVDHLEDGYRWRKYGQKAVKNSHFPRSYYRCTTQKCTVKKRVERCHEDPTTVVTTYEGQHNHPIPSCTMRGPGAVSNHMLSSQMSFSRDNNSMITTHNAGPIENQTLTQMGTSAISFPPDHVVHNQHHFPDYGLLQDMLPSMFFFKHDQ